MTDNAPRFPETTDAALLDVSREALLAVLKSDRSALANSVRSVTEDAKSAAEKYAAFGSATDPARRDA